MLKIMLIALAVTLLLSMFLVLFLTKVYKKRFDAMPLEPGPDGWHDLAEEDLAERNEEKAAGWLSWTEEAKDEWNDWDAWERTNAESQEKSEIDKDSE